MYALLGFVCHFLYKRTKKGFEKCPSPRQDRSAPYPLAHALVQNNYLEQKQKKV